MEGLRGLTVEVLGPHTPDNCFEVTIRRLMWPLRHRPISIGAEVVEPPRILLGLPARTGKESFPEPEVGKKFSDLQVATRTRVAEGSRPPSFECGSMYPAGCGRGFG